MSDLYDMLESQEAAGNTGMEPTEFRNAMAAGNYQRYHGQAFPAVTRRPDRSTYWMNGSPVLEKADYNGESLMVPKIAPSTEGVTIKKVVLDRTLSIIKQHTSGSKVTWLWRCSLLGTRFVQEAPSALTIAQNCLPELAMRQVPNVYTYSDVRLHPVNIRNELAIDDPANPNDVLAASRADVRTISLTLTFSPRLTRPTSATIQAGLLPEATSFRVYFDAPLQAAVAAVGALPAVVAGLDARITKVILENTPEVLLNLYPLLVFKGLRNNNMVIKDVYDDWINDQRNRAYYDGMSMIIRSIYIGADIATDDLTQRFHKLTQRMYDTHQRRAIYMTVSEYGRTFFKLVDETQGWDEPTLMAQVPEMDAVFYRGLVTQLKDKPSLAALTQHPRSATFGENMNHLTAIIEEAKVQERNVNQIIQIAANTSNAARRTAVGGASSNTFAALPPVVSTPVRPDSEQPEFTIPASGPHRLQASLPDSPFRNVRQKTEEVTQVEHAYTMLSNAEFAYTMLSNAETALRKASNTNAPIQCWGCKNIHADDNHLYRECPHKNEPAVMSNFKKHFDEFLENRRKRNTFDPNRYKRDGFMTKKASQLWNLCNQEDLEGDVRTSYINSFITEHMAHAPNGVLTRHVRKANAENQDQDGPSMLFPCWPILQDEAEYESPNKISGLTCHVQATNETIRFPIAIDLPHVTIPVGKNSEHAFEGLFDSGGSCNMGDLAYWTEIANRFPSIIANFHTLEDHRLEPIAIGGIGAGRVELTHVMEMWLPWVINGQTTKFVVGLGVNMPLTLLIGLPFQLAAKCVCDIDNLTCHSKTFSATWKLTLKSPRKKCVRSLDAAEAASARVVLLNTVSPSPSGKRLKMVTWDSPESRSNE